MTKHPATKRPPPGPASIADQVAPRVKPPEPTNVLTQGEIDALVAQNESLKADNDNLGVQNAALKASLDAKDVAYDALAAEVLDMRELIKKRSGDTVIGVAHPLKTDHLPKLGDLPAHKALDD